MSDEDNIIREVEEDLRRERYERLWKKFGPFVIGTVVLVLVSMLGWQQYQAWQDRERAREAGEFLAAADLLEQGKEAEAAKAFEELAAEAGGGYRALGHLYAGEAHLKQGNPEQALAEFEALASDGSADPKLRGVAALKAGLLLADSAPPEELKKQLTPALRPNSPWRYAAQEIMAYAHYRSGQTGKARNAYQALVNEYDAPAHIRERARSMVGLIASEKAQGVGREPSPETEQAPAETDEEAPEPAGDSAAQAETEETQKGGSANEAASAPEAAPDAAEGEEPQ
ncbi:MAG: tetratricopeptide repeat protein [bacterium]